MATILFGGQLRLARSALCCQQISQLSFWPVKGQPSFTSTPKVPGKKRLPKTRVSLKHMLRVLLTGQPSPPRILGTIPTQPFLTGCKEAIDKISHGIANNDIEKLDNYLTRECLLNLLDDVLPRVPFLEDEVILNMPVRQEDIFFQFLGGASLDDGEKTIEVVSFSLMNLDLCTQNKNNYDKFNADLQEKARLNNGVLLRSHMDSNRYREITVAYEDLNLDRLVQEREILVTNYTFTQKSDDSEWNVSKISHIDTGRLWFWPSRFVWKGRIHISLNFNMDFYQVLRYDYMITFGALAIFLYLQILAVIIGSKIEEEEKRRDQPSDLRRQFTDPGYGPSALSGTSSRQ